MHASDRRNRPLYAILIFAVFLNVCLWLYSHRLYVRWTNVPDAPKLVTAQAAFLGDSQFSYRVWALALQNFGNVGRTQPLKAYNYKYLGNWFRLMDRLDPASRYVPFIVAYYFSATQDKTQLPVVIDYLEMVGKRPGPKNWRWLAEATFLARHGMHDMDRALRLAEEMGRIYRPGMPLWVRNMEAMVKADMGDRDAAYLLALQILKSDGETMNESEYRATVGMVCHSILTAQQAATNPLCQQ